MRGTTAPPAGLHDVDWASVDDAYGTADEAPLFIVVAHERRRRPELRCARPVSVTTHQGSVYPASEWLPRVSEVDGYDLAFKVPGHRIGTALARSGEPPARFHPMIKPHHRSPEYSTVPLPLLRELAELLPAHARSLMT
ncbi:hypothetical protein SAMN04488564_102382 [Lentzea waywayandensis]|uniref:Uncharacterized protein n=1 Tax=Lentzea waywayandensis TaxID=84724 RepID=A0A1I6DEE6_9PSEU|nr:hypothetical protein SAMN04488564_102382 [Lentzea waywayandensis]